MSAVTDFFGYSIPWWTWLVPGLGLVAFVYLRFGRTAAVGLAVAIVAALLDRRGRQAGWQAKADEQKRSDEEFVNDYRKQEAESDARPDAELDERNAPWVRK